MPEELRIVPRLRCEPSPTVRDLLAVLFRQRRVLTIVFAGIFLAVLLYGIFAPPYESEMKVLLRKGRVDPVVTSTPSQPEFQREGVTEEEVNSECELLQDDEILRTVVQNAGLMGIGNSWPARLFGDSDEKRLARAVRRIQKRLTIEPVRKTAMVRVAYQSADAGQGVAVLRHLAAAYLDRHHQVHRPSGEFGFFDQQVTQSRSGLEAAELQLMQFNRDEGVISATQERDITLQKLSEVDTDHRRTQVALAENAERTRALQQKLSMLPERTLTQIRNSDNPQLMEKMKGQLLDLELKRTELLTEFEPTYRSVQEVSDEIEHTRKMIAAEDQAPIRDQVSELEPNHAWAKAELMKAEVEDRSLVAHEKAEAALVGHYQKAAYELGDRAIKQEQLFRDLKAAEEKYLLYVNKREEARIGDALDQGGILNVVVAEQPTTPILPKISVLGFGLIGLGLAGTLSTGVAFVVDYLSPALRTPDEVFSYLGSPVLASLPSKPWERELVEGEQQ